MSYSIQNGNKYNTPKNFDNWSNSSENYNKASNGEKVEDFQLFKKDLSTYSSDLKKFACPQKVIIIVHSFYVGMPT